MTTTYPPILDTHTLDDATLAQCVADLFADPAAPPRLVCQVLYDLLVRRPEDADHANQEWVCMDVLDLNAQVLNGGFDQWVFNGYVYRGRETVAALHAIGALKAARLLERALRALPEPLRTQVHSGEDVGAYTWWLPSFGPKREAYFEKLTQAYFDRPATEDIDPLVAAYARRHGIGLDAAA